MKKIGMSVLLTAALFLTGCSEKEIPEETSAQTTTVTDPEPDHSMLRSFTLNEAFAEVTAAGRVFAFPIPLTELEEGGSFSDCQYTDSRLTFPDGTYAQAYSDGSSINCLRFELGSSPSDFSVVGLNLGSGSDIIFQTGIPDYMTGDMERGSAGYTGAGRQCINIEFKEGKLLAVTITQ